MVLVVDGHLQQHRVRGREGGDGGRQPGGQAVGVHGDGHAGARHALGCQRRQGALQILFQQLHLVHVLAQAPARFRGAAGLVAYHQRAADALFQQADALRNGRWRHVQSACRALETAFADDGGQCGEGGIIEHE